MLADNTSLKSNPNRNNIKPVKFVVLVLAAVGAVVFTVVSSYSDSIAQDALKKTDSISSQKTADATKQSDPENMKKLVALNKLKTDLKNYIAKYKGKFGIYYISLTDGTEFGINEMEPIKAASTVKVPINLYFYQKAAQGKIKLDSTMTYTSGDYATGTGSIQYGKTGRKFSVKELSRLSIVESDNVATNMLVRLLGKRNYKDFMKQMGGKIVNYDDNLSCAKDMALYVKKTYEFAKSNPVQGGLMIKYLENTIFNDRLPVKLPKGIKVAHKIGNYQEAVNDVGIVYTAKPYVIAVMTKNANLSGVNNVIATISKMVYDYSIKN